MYALEAAMAAALLARSQMRLPANRNEARRTDAGDDILREGVGGLLRLALAIAIIAAFCLAMQVASHLAAPADAPQVAIGQAG